MLKGPTQLDKRVPVEVGTIQVNFCKNPQRQGQHFGDTIIYLLSFLFGPGFSGLRERFSSFSSPLTKLLLPSGLPVFSWRRIFLTFCSSVTVERNSFQSAMSKEEFLKRYCGGVEPKTKTAIVIVHFQTPSKHKIINFVIIDIRSF